MVFIIKASFRGETRRWTNNDNLFPTYQTISDQVNKVFRITDDFYLAKITFSPHPGVGGTATLIGEAVHTAEEWAETVAAPFMGRPYPTGMLRFFVHDEALRPDSLISTTTSVDSTLNRSSGSSVDQDIEMTHPQPVAQQPQQQPQEQPAQQTLQTPPVEEPASSSPTSSMTRSSVASCCSVSQGKDEFKSIVDNFLRDFNRTVSQTFGEDIDMNTARPVTPPPPPTPQQSVPGAYEAAPAGPVIHEGIWCDRCNEIVKGIRYKCLNCFNFDLCQNCVDNEEGKGVHNAFYDTEHSFLTIPLPDNAGTRTPVPQAEPTVPHGAFCDVCKERIVGVRHKCLDCADYDMCSRCLASSRGQHPASHELRGFTTNDPIIVHNAYCDVCNKKIVGTRHKCLDCPNFDMCSNCIATSRAQHPSLHQFFELTEPGRIVVHNVDAPAPVQNPPASSAEDQPHPFHHHHHRERPCRRLGPHGFARHRPHEARSINPAPALPPRTERDSSPPPPVVHNARCDMCDSRIRGTRYKCLDCPDFDSCESCFSIMPEQHPKHHFIKITNPDNFIHRVNAHEGDIIHHAVCDSCQKQIQGVRFKCLHQSCPDYDLCQHCEALPIRVHPDSHPLVKLVNQFTSYEGLKQVFDFVHKPASEPQPTVIVLSSTNDSASTPSPTIIRIGGDSSYTPPAQVSTTAANGCPSPIVITTSPNTISNPFMLASLPLLNPESAATDITFQTASPGLPSPPVIVRITQQPVQPEVEDAPEQHMPGTLPPPSAPAVQAVFPPVFSPIQMSQKLSRPISVATSTSDPFDDTNALRASVASLLTLASTSAPVPAAPVEPRISASFVKDNNLPDGHILPAGANFQKSWKVRNDGNVEWPVGTQLVFVGGDRLGTTSLGNFVVSERPQPGGDVDLKIDFCAPSLPGRYTSYWRLRDAEGRIFGHRMWCDIIVLEEQTSRASSESNPSLSSSTVIMPNAADITAPIISLPTVIPGSPTISSVHSEADADVISMAGSEADVDDIISSSSSVSSVMDGDLDSDDPDLWEEAMGQGSSGEPDEFVVVYESESTDRED